MMRKFLAIFFSTILGSLLTFTTHLTAESVVLNSVKFVFGQRIFEPKSFDHGESSDEIGAGYKVGTFIDGPYKGYDLIVTTYGISEPCKGVGARDSCPDSHLRFAKKGNNLVYFPRISWNPDGLSVKRFRKLGFTLHTEAKFTIPVLAYPDTLTGPEKDQILVYDFENQGIINLAESAKVFHHPVFGDVYTSVKLIEDSLSQRPPFEPVDPNGFVFCAP
ncbi:hypothetical protein HYR99_16515 [Candidatus Poribacteria bacterium]|nr:hypothetical protein [Candidatus Poribacteria bacterium]